jgi:rhodanese-related sulfurtransferase
MKEKTVAELKQMLDNKEDFQLIDVREQHEFEICNLNAELIPMGDVPDNVAKFSKDKPVVIHCRSGSRSGRVCDYLEQNFGYTNVYNLKGGILAWADQIDPAMQKY